MFRHAAERWNERSDETHDRYEYLAAEAAAAEAAAAEAARGATVESVAAMAEAEVYRRAVVEDEATLALEEAEQLHREASAATAELGMNMDASTHEAARISVQHAAAVAASAEAKRGGAVAGVGVAEPLDDLRGENYDTVLTLLQEAEQGRKAERRRAVEAERDLAEQRTLFELREQERRLETHHLVIKLRRLEAASSHAAAFEVRPPEWR